MNSFHYEINDIPSKLQGQCQRKATIIANAEQIFMTKLYFPDVTAIQSSPSAALLPSLVTAVLFLKKAIISHVFFCSYIFILFSVLTSLLCFLFKFNLNTTLFSRNGLKFTLVTPCSRSPLITVSPKA